MILNKGECVICETHEEFEEAWKLIKAEGYRWWSNSPLSIPGSKRGFRWCHGHEYPNCIATLDARMAENVCRSGKVDDDSDEEEYFVLTAYEFLNCAVRAAHIPSIDDLL